MKDSSMGTRKKFVQVSLSSEFAAELRGQAEAADRSMASQLEHWAKIARALEAVIPAATLTELKKSTDAGEILARVGAFLLQQDTSGLVSRLEAARTPRYGVDEADPDVAIRIDPDGTETRGRFDAAGQFIPTATERMEKHERRSEASSPSKRDDKKSRPAARPVPPAGRKRHPQPA